MSGDALLAAATRVGDWLLESSVRGPHGLFWKSQPYRANAAAGEFVLWENVYSGSAGIARLLAELFRLTGAERFLHAADETLRWAAWRAGAEHDLNGSYLSGRTGIAAAMVRVAEVAGRPLPAGLAEIALGGGAAPEAPGSRFDWLGGAAGTLWGMCNLYGATGDPRCLEGAARALDTLVGGAVLGRNGGLGWLEAEVGADALCGFSHGSSGVAFALTELAGWARQPGAAWLAELAFRHEDQYFVPEWRNWRDLRQAWTPEALDRAAAAYRRGEAEYFTRGFNMVAWCHGAPGIALARLRAWEAGGEDHHLHAARLALATTERWLDGVADESLSLCHGRCGNASVLVEASRALGDPSLFAAAARVAAGVAGAVLAERAPAGISGVGENPGLFAGIAGVGYFLVEAADPLNTPSLLAPRLAAAHRPVSWSPRPLAAAPWTVAGGAWPCTARVLAACGGDPAERLTAAVAAGAELREGVRALVAEVPPGHALHPPLQEAWALDLQCEALRLGGVSHSHTLVEAHVAALTAGAAVDEGIDLDARVRWSPQVRVHAVRWPWERVRAGEPVDFGPPDGGALLLRRTAGSVDVRRLDAADAGVLELARDGARVEDLLDAGDARALDDVGDVIATLLLRGELVLDALERGGGVDGA